MEYYIRIAILFLTSAIPSKYSIGTCPLPSFTSLETLQLISVNISGQVLEYFISNCPSLQLLRVENSNGLIDLKVNDPSISLKHLQLRACYKLKNLAIRAPSLLSFVYLGPEVNIVVEDLSHLVKLHLSISWALFSELFYSSGGVNTSSR